MTLRLFILNNGREVIGKQSKQDSDQYFWVESPRILHFNPTADGASYGIELYPYSLTNPDGLHKFHLSAIASESENIPDDVEKGYIQHTSGISIVSSIIR